MASQVFSGSSNPTYTNTTGQNVRLILNFISNPSSMSWSSTTTTVQPFPREIMLSPGDSFSALCGPYNIIALKEDGT